MFLLSFFFWHIKHLKCLTCCDGGRRSHIHTLPLSSGCGVPNSPCGGGHVSLRVTGAAGCCVLQSCMGHLSPDPRDHSLLLRSVCWMTDCTAPPQTSLPATANTNLPPPAHFIWCNPGTQVHTYAPIHTWGSSDNLSTAAFSLRLIQLSFLLLYTVFMHGWLE